MLRYRRLALVLPFVLATAVQSQSRSAIPAEAERQRPETAFIDGWSIVELPDLPGGSHSSGTALNDSGDVVGWYSGPFVPNRAFLYSEGKMTDMGTFGGPNSMASGINNRKTAVGHAHASPLDVYAFCYQSGSLHALPGLDLSNSEATAINDSGDIVGMVTMPKEGGARAFLYSSGKLKLLGSPGGTYSIARAIGRNGQVVGESYAAGMESAHAVIFNRDGSVTDLGTLGGRHSAATGINDRGDIVGGSGTTMITDRTPHAFLYTNGRMHDLGTLGGPSSHAGAINNAGTIAGASETAAGALHAVIWESGTIRDLNDLAVVAARGWTRLYTASAINNKGQITGSGFINGVSHAFVLTPGPKPTPAPQANR